ncbi:hypothetical protein [Alkaliphilus hydrothermalis]|uniref:Uncharacterized protein n=1 Tax=Alkaliphilus hydrothermalis TaxID=1482730 RepID=A0ABS2NS46_9FIRM|nr:hypothetical protein [Alkaliphilus hydrothermalis]MBM7615772.1 hypothetical protein [Alkaliphilus hydrothermalis]
MNISNILLLAYKRELIVIKKKNSPLFRTNFDYEEDPYDQLNNLQRQNKNNQSFTNKGTMKKFEFDYEEDPYEPENNR